MAWLEGTTAAGVTVYIIDDPYLNRSTPILINGEPVALAPGFGSVRRMRDGGTTTIRTERGVIHWRRTRRAQELGTLPTLDGADIVPSVWPGSEESKP